MAKRRKRAGGSASRAADHFWPCSSPHPTSRPRSRKAGKRGVYLRVVWGGSRTGPRHCTAARPDWTIVSAVADAGSPRALAGRVARSCPPAALTDRQSNMGARPVAAAVWARRGPTLTLLASRGRLRTSPAVRRWGGASSRYARGPFVAGRSGAGAWQRQRARRPPVPPRRSEWRRNVPAPWDRGSVAACPPAVDSRRPPSKAHVRRRGALAAFGLPVPLGSTPFPIPVPTSAVDQPTRTARPPCPPPAAPMVSSRGSSAPPPPPAAMPVTAALQQPWATALPAAVARVSGAAQSTLSAVSPRLERHPSPRHPASPPTLRRMRTRSSPPSPRGSRLRHLSRGDSEGESGGAAAAGHGSGGGRGGGRPAVGLPCGHAFHAGCLGRWLTEADRCPLCGRGVRAAVDAARKGGERKRRGGGGGRRDAVGAALAGRIGGVMRGSARQRCMAKQWASDGRCRRCTRPKLNDVLTGPPKGDPTLSTAAPCSTWPEGGGTARGPPHEPAVAPASGAPAGEKQAPSCSRRVPRSFRGGMRPPWQAHGMPGSHPEVLWLAAEVLRRSPSDGIPRGAARRRGETRGLEPATSASGWTTSSGALASRGRSCHPAAPIGWSRCGWSGARQLSGYRHRESSWASTATSCDADRPAVAPSVRVMPRHVLAIIGRGRRSPLRWSHQESAEGHTDGAAVENASVLTNDTATQRSKRGASTGHPPPSII
ncbi:LOW QUALITY PROTEIN: hypothetical protein BU14_1087s0001 [Porphyra umbilicalis]|uniref:RING-type domain-containing protein n=1 Tax=Porphyra umbilicalis TaxID=2786 RepID=A0A1X6NMI0_PORUM|nr:LOW QUALITY PROTEIN: hypothetical protein BU14_1087s0001 [Porphyra umbilicalis]|eukprot:OSX69831.1 LOW QUALITY PROTEIN: hypothetical protein BU14_1087s0001 [Porphyra umbilicalis]